jgi:hypothetical protein
VRPSAYIDNAVHKPSSLRWYAAVCRASRWGRRRQSEPPAGRSISALESPPFCLRLIVRHRGWVKTLRFSSGSL